MSGGGEVSAFRGGDLIAVAFCGNKICERR